MGTRASKREDVARRENTGPEDEQLVRSYSTACWPEANGSQHSTTMQFCVEHTSQRWLTGHSVSLWPQMLTMSSSEMRPNWQTCGSSGEKQ